MRPIFSSFTSLAALCLLGPAPAGAVPIQDARARQADFGLAWQAPWVSERESPGNVFQVLNTGYLTSIQLPIFGRNVETPSPLVVELWVAAEGLAVQWWEPDGGLIELLATSETMPVDAIDWSPDSPAGYHFAFDDPSPVVAGQWLGFRVIATNVAAGLASGARIWGSEPEPWYPAFTAWVDPDYDPLPDPDLLPGDVNGDLTVGLDDFGILKGNFGLAAGAMRAQGDLSGDGKVDLTDFGLLKENFGQGGTAAVPEPAGLVLAAAGAAAIALAWRSRRR